MMPTAAAPADARAEHARAWAQNREFIERSQKRGTNQAKLPQEP
jgi:hypothetical protein